MVAVVEVVEVALALARFAGDVEAGLLAGARESNVAPLLQALAARTEHEGAVDRDALRRVTGQRVAVADVSRLEIGAAELGALAAVGQQRQRAAIGVDSFDGSARSVADAERVRVAEADNTIARCELACGELEALGSESAVRFHQGARECVQLGDVAAAKRDHDVAGKIVAGCRPPVGEQAGAGCERRLGGDEPA